MRILVISDTHIPEQYRRLEPIIEEEAKKSDYCLHCGDFTNYSLYETLSKWTKVYGVAGNMDSADIQKELPKKQLLNLENLKIGLTHGSGQPQGLIKYLQHEFASELKNLDIIVFGHAHNPTNEEINGVIYFNPGSCTDTIFAAKRTYGILETTDSGLKRRIVEIE
tara:strand:+ start:3840 stop:4337 length:498 start_codon:yes stop_codon:yes gene_type:complete